MGTQQSSASACGSKAEENPPNREIIETKTEELVEGEEIRATGGGPPTFLQKVSTCGCAPSKDTEDKTSKTDPLSKLESTAPRNFTNRTTKKNEGLTLSQPNKLTDLKWRGCKWQDNKDVSVSIRNHKRVLRDTGATFFVEDSKPRYVGVVTQTVSDNKFSAAFPEDSGDAVITTKTPMFILGNAGSVVRTNGNFRSENKSYCETLSQADRFHSVNEDIKVFWILGRFLANETIATKIIGKYQNLSQGIEQPQEMISHFLRVSLDNLSPGAVSFLLSEEHRFYQGLHVPYELKSIKQLVENSDVWAKAMKGTARGIIDSLQKLEAVKATIHSSVRFKLSGPDKVLNHVEFQNVLNAPEFTATPPVLVTESRILCTDWNQTDGRPWSLIDTGKAVGLRKNLKCPAGLVWKLSGNENDTEMWFDTEPMLHEIDGTPPLASESRFLKNEPPGITAKEMLWPWNADCEKLLQRIRCLVDINTTLKNISAQSDDQETESDQKTKGKSVECGKAKPLELEVRSSDEEIELDTDERLQQKSSGCLEFDTLRAEISKTTVSGLCKIWTIFPFFDRKSQAMNFLKVPVKKSDTISIFEMFSNVIQCDCSLTNTAHETDESSFASLTCSPGQGHFHDSLVLDLILPAHGKSESLEAVPAETMHFLDILSRYVCQVRAQSMEIVGLRMSDKVIEDHLREVQSLCQTVFCFIVFSEACGAAEQSMTGGFYLTAARNHYESASDSAIEAGIYPTFINFVNTTVACLPKTLRFVKKPAIYMAALNFLDTDVSDIMDTSIGNVLNNCRRDLESVEPAAVSVLETILGTGYQHTIDDEAAYKALIGQANLRGDSVALVSPILDLSSPEDSSLHFYGFGDVTLVSHRGQAEMRSQIEQEAKALLEDVAMTYDQEFSRRVSDEKSTSEQGVLNVKRSVLSEQMYSFFDNLQKGALSADAETSKGQKTEQNAKVSNITESSPDESSEQITVQVKVTETVTSEKITENGKDQNTMTRDTEENAGKYRADMKSEADGSGKANQSDTADASKAKKKKTNRDYLSPAKRQQRQAQRLREKWEKKHKSENNAQPQDEA